MSHIVTSARGNRRLGKNIRQRRELKNHSQRDMAVRTGVQQRTIWSIENGEILPSGSQAASIAAYFNSELTELHLLYPEKYPAPDVVTVEQTQKASQG